MSISEMKIVTEKLKPEKALGLDDIRPEMIKYMEKEGTKLLEKTLKKYQMTGKKR